MTRDPVILICAGILFAIAVSIGAELRFRADMAELDASIKSLSRAVVLP